MACAGHFLGLAEPIVEDALAWIGKVAAVSR